MRCTIAAEYFEVLVTGSANMVSTARVLGVSRARVPATREPVARIGAR